MSDGFLTTLAAARALAPAERRELAGALEDGLDVGPVVMRESWKREHDRRMAEMTSGTMKVFTLEQLEAKWAAEAELEPEGGVTMSPEFQAALAAAEALPDEQRRELVEALDASFDDALPELSEAWKQELARRWAEFEAGLTTATPLEELRAKWAAQGAALGAAQGAARG